MTSKIRFCQNQKKNCPQKIALTFFDTYPLELCFGELLAMVKYYGLPQFFKPANVANGHWMLENGKISRRGQVSESGESANVSYA